MKIYETPVLEMLELFQEQAVMTGSSTGESFGNQDSFTGSWA